MRQTDAAATAAGAPAAVWGAERILRRREKRYAQLALARRKTQSDPGTALARAPRWHLSGAATDG